MKRSQTTRAAVILKLMELTKGWIFGLTLLLCGVCFLFAAGTPELIRICDVTYSETATGALHLDIVQPAEGGPALPAILFLHGGGFKSGSKHQMRGELEQAARRGYAGVGVEYRLTDSKGADPDRRYPVQIEDVKAAVRWLRAHAETYALDPGRIGVAGFSAGATLALYLGQVPPTDEARVQAVVAAAPAVSFLHLDYTQRYLRNSMRRFLGTTPEENPTLYAAASPLAAVSAADAPALVLFGAQDRLIGTGQVPELKAAIERSGADVEIRVVPGGRHSFVSLAAPQYDAPLWAFMDARLK